VLQIGGYLDLSRRDFLNGVSLFCAASTFGKGQSRHLPELRFPSGPRQRLAVTSWPFRAYIDSGQNRYRDVKLPGWDIRAFPGMIAEKFNVHNINPLGDHFSSVDAGYLDDFRKAVDAAKSHVVDLGIGGQSVYSRDASQRKEAVEYGRKWIDVAVAIGSPSIRQHIKGIRDVTPDVSLASGTLAEIAQYGSRRNVIVNLENDNAIAEDPFFIVAVIQKVNNPYLRALPDMGNSLGAHDAEFNAKAVKAMFEHAYGMAHVKDSVQCGTGTCAVDLKRMFAIAKASSYRGYFSMEFDTKGGKDPFEGTRHLIEETLEYLS